MARSDMSDPSGSAGLPPGTRTTEPVITHHGAVRDAWPHVAKRLSAYLRQRGAPPPQDADDIVQECALKVLSREVPFTNSDELLRWCLTVARNAHIDLHRGQRGLAMAILPDRATSSDVAEEVAARLRLQAVVDSWPRLSPTDQRVLVEAAEGVPAPPVRRDAVRLYVQRNRARQRLQSLIAALVGVFVAVGRAVRRQALPVTTVTAAATVTCLALPLSPSTESPALRLIPEQSIAQAAVDASGARPLAARIPAPTSALAATQTHPGVERSSTRAVASAQGPDGYGARVTSHDRPASPPTLLCVGDLPVAPDACVPDPTQTVAHPVRK